MNSSFLHKTLALIVATLVWCNISIAQSAAPVDCEYVFTQMFNAVKTVKTMRYNLFGLERIEDKYIPGNSTVKLSVSPFKTYFKNTDNGIEVLYCEGGDNEALINPNGFPYFNVHLDPHGKMMRKNQHHTIFRLGYTYLTNVLYYSLSKYPDAYKKYISYVGDTVWDGQACYKIQVNFSDFAYTNYTVTQEGETVTKIAAKYGMNDYEVLNTNKLSWYDDELKVGKIIQLPNTYGKLTIMFIRKDIFLPVVIRVYDNKGLLEEYTYTKLQINPYISDDEFTEDFSGYHF